MRLQFPWLDDTYVSDWTRTVQIGGLGGGGIFPLDVNDEVLVAFDRGALDHPFVIGGLYNGRDKPTDSVTCRCTTPCERRPAGTPSPTGTATGWTCSARRPAVASRACG